MKGLPQVIFVIFENICGARINSRNLEGFLAACQDHNVSSSKEKYCEHKREEL